MRSFLFALTMVLVYHRLHDNPITFFIQPIFLVRPLIYPANSIRSDGRRQCIPCYGDAARDKDFRWEQATTMPLYVDLRFQRRGPRGVLEHSCILLTKDTVLHGRCQRPTFVSKRATTERVW